MRTRCPSCHDKLDVDDENVNQDVECPSCGEVFEARASRSQPAGSRSDRGSDRPASRSERDDEDHTRRRRRRPPEDDDYDDRPARRYYDDYDPPKSRLTYILLALFLGGLGVHNFYAGRNNIAIAQLLINLISWPLILVFIGCMTVFIPGIWAIVDIIVVDRDGQGRRMV